ncbi:MAG TPA: TonB-dependent receptor [Hyphomonadaceae bacterium]|nr:TonB-dependent receptor [Hyphomonadaceae bacterium]
MLLSTTLLGISAPAILAAPASAQAQPAATSEQSDTVVITGTRIVREGYVSSSPITTVTADEIQAKQPVDVEDVLRAMPQFMPGNGGQVNNGSAGASTLDLRGLTTPRTLPLIDGHRMVGFDPNGLFDVTAIPIALLERVDVVTGGASAVYGSDAVAGVVNFILNDEFKGVQLDASYGITDHGDGETETYQATMGAGFDGGKGNVALSIGYANKEAVYQTRGPGSATPGASSTTDPTGIDSAVGARTQIDPTGNLVPFYHGFDFNPQNLYQTPQTRWNATALAKYAINDHVEAYSRFIYSNSESAPQLASSGTFGFSFAVPLNNPFLTTQASNYLAANNTVGTCAALNPYSVTAPAGNCVKVGLRWRSVAVGPRQYDFHYDTFQNLIGLRGDFWGWDWDLAAAHGETSLKRQQNNDVSADRIQQALFAASTTACSDPSNFCAPLNLFNPATPIIPAALDFIRFNLQVQSVTKQDYVTFSASRDLGDFKSPWATSPIAISVGAEYRGESANYQPDAASQSGSSPGFGQTLPTRGRYDVNEGFAEAIIPVIENMAWANKVDVELGFRHSDYSTSGGTDSYKYGADWEPINGLRFRGMFQRAVRAANIAELFNPVTPGTGDLLVDPCANGTPGHALTGQLAALCVATGVPAAAITNATLAQPTSGQVNSFFGGNPNLTPEKADTKTFGLVWQPDWIPHLGVTLDYYDIKVDNAISIRPNYDIVDGCYNPARNTTMTATNADCQLIARNTTNGTIEGDLIYGIQQVTQNIGNVHAEGIDYGVRYSWDLGQWGGLDVALDGTHVLTSSYVPAPGGATVDCVAHYGKQCGLPSTVSGSTGGPTPEDHFVQRTTWSFGPFDVGYNWRYLSGSTVDPTQTATSDPQSLKIGAYNYLDLQAGWQVTDWAKLKFSVTNVLDKEAPFVATETGSTIFNSGNTYPSTYDVLGRVFTVGFTTKF